MLMFQWPFIISIIDDRPIPSLCGRGSCGWTNLNHQKCCWVQYGSESCFELLNWVNFASTLSLTVDRMYTTTLPLYTNIVPPLCLLFLLSACPQTDTV